MISTSHMDRPLYSLTDAGRLLQVPASTLRFWLEGARRGQQVYLPVLRSESKGSSILTWGEFVEAAYLREYRDEMSVQKLRPLIEALREELGVRYPLASAQPLTDGMRLVMNLQRSLALPEELWMVVGERQLVLGDAAAAYFKRIEFDPDTLEALRYTVLDSNPPVVVDPRLAFGIPTIKGVRTESVAELVLAGEPPAAILQIYRGFGLTQSDLELAVRFEQEFLGVAA